MKEIRGLLLQSDRFVCNPQYQLNGLTSNLTQMIQPSEIAMETPAPYQANNNYATRFKTLPKKVYICNTCIKMHALSF